MPRTLGVNKKQLAINFISPKPRYNTSDATCLASRNTRNDVYANEAKRESRRYLEW